MKKLLIASAIFFVGVSAHAGLMDVYNTIDTNTNENSTIVDKKAAEWKTKIADKVQTKTETGIAEKEELKAKLEETLADLKADGEGQSEKALQIKKEIESLQRLIDAARK